jgi:hypothetical protein
MALPHANRATCMLLAAVAASGACTTDAPALSEPADRGLSETGAALRTQLGIDSQYMRRVTGVTDADGMSTHAVDLADPGQYQFVVNRLAAAGKTPASSLHLFERLEAARTQALARARTGTVRIASVAGCVGFVLPGVQRRTGSSLRFINTHPEVSCFGGVPYVYADITTYLSNVAGTQNIIVASAAAEDLSGGINFPPVRIDPTLPIARGKLNRTESLLIAFDDLGNELIQFTSISTSLQVTANIAVEDPVASPESLPFPTRGTVSVLPGTGTCAIKTLDIADSRLRLVKQTRGGFCATGLTRSPTDEPNHGTVAFEAAITFAHAGGGDATECDETALRTEPLTPAFTVRGTAACGPDTVPFFASHTTGDDPTLP